MMKNRLKNNRKSIHDRIVRKMYKARGQIFTASDFSHYGSRNSIDKALSQLSKRAEIERLAWGFYYMPKEDKMLGPVAPNALDIANAIARKQKSNLLVSGAQAANDLGLSTQVPAQYEFYTNGWPLKIQFKKMIITFKHRSINKMAGAGKVSGHIFQALRYLGQENIMESTIDTICSRLSEQSLKTLKEDTLLAPLWMQPIIKEIITRSEKLYYSS